MLLAVAAAATITTTTTTTAVLQEVASKTAGVIAAGLQSSSKGVVRVVGPWALPPPTPSLSRELN